MSINLRHISHSFGNQRALNDVNLDIKAGELIALLGPSGCGKTTLLRLIAGLEQVQHGEISIHGEIVGQGQGVHRVPELRGIGLMFQEYALFPHMTVGQNIAYGLSKSQHHRRIWIKDMMGQLGMQNMIDRYPHTLSGGQQQRVALLRALAPEPKTILLDEPFSALDEHLRQQVREETLDILKQTKTAAIMVTHDPEEAMFLADRIAVMSDGDIKQCASPEQVYNQPENAFVASLFGPSNQVKGNYRAGKLDCVFGQFELENAALCEGEVDVVVRARDCLLQLEPLDESSPSVEIISVHPMGNETHIRVRLSEQPDIGIIHVRIMGHWGGDAKANWKLHINPQRCYCFTPG